MKLDRVLNLRMVSRGDDVVSPFSERCKWGPCFEGAQTLNVKP